MYSPIDSIDPPEPIDESSDTGEISDDADSIDGDISSDSDILEDLSNEILEDGMSEQAEDSQGFDDMAVLGADDGLVLGAHEGGLIETFPSSIEYESGTEPTTQILDTSTSVESDGAELPNNSVHKIICDDGSYGSGFFIDTTNIDPKIAEHLNGDKLFLTNAHVTDADMDGQVRISIDGQTINAQIKSVPKSFDVAILKIEEAELKNVNISELSLAEDLQEGEQIIQAGYPESSRGNLTIDFGNVVSADHSTSLPHPNGKVYTENLQHTARSDPGDSGGPLLNDDGDVIGINSGIHPDGAYSGVNATVIRNIIMDSFQLNLL